MLRPFTAIWRNTKASRQPFGAILKPCTKRSVQYSASRQPFANPKPRATIVRKFQALGRNQAHFSASHRHRALILSIVPPSCANSKHWAAIRCLFQASRHHLALFLSIAPLSGTSSWHCTAPRHLSIIVGPFVQFKHSPHFISCCRKSCVRQMLAAAFGDLVVTHAIICWCPAHFNFPA